MSLTPEELNELRSEIIKLEPSLTSENLSNLSEEELVELASELNKTEEPSQQSSKELSLEGFGRGAVEALPMAGGFAGAAIPLSVAGPAGIPLSVWLAGLGAGAGESLKNILKAQVFNEPVSRTETWLGPLQQFGAGMTGEAVAGKVSSSVPKVIEKYGEKLFKYPFRKIDAELFAKNQKGSKTPFSDLLWKYKISGNYADVKQAIDLIAEKENYPAIKEMKKIVDEGTLGLTPDELIAAISSGLKAPAGKTIPFKNVLSSVTDEILETVSRKKPLGPVLDYKPPGTVGYTPYPEQMSMVPKGEITGFKIFPEEGEPPLSEAFWRVISGGKKPPAPFIGPRQSIVTPVYEPTLVPEPPGVPFQTEMENIVLGNKVIPNTKLSFSDISDITKAAQERADFSGIETGIDISSQKDAYKQIAKTLRNIRNKMAEQVSKTGTFSDELYQEYLKAQKELGVIQSARKPLTSLVKQESSRGITPTDITTLGIPALLRSILSPEFLTPAGKIVSATGRNLERIRPEGLTSGILKTIPYYLQPNLAPEKAEEIQLLNP